MEKHLIHLTTCTRIEGEPNAVTRALVSATEMKTCLWLLGRKGSKRRLQGAQVAALGTPQQYTKAAEEGLLYEEGSEGWAFAPELDESTRLPLLMERYDEAFAKRSYAGKGEETQATMDLNAPAT